MRLGGYVFYDGTDPEQYALAHVAKGFGAAVVPHWVTRKDPAQLKAFKQAMKKHDVTIAEVGAWCNPMHPDPKEAESKIQYMIERLKLAEELEACTCVNILGSKSTEMWDGPCMEGYSQSFIDEAVQISQRVIDAVKPQHTKLSFEMMPFYFLDGPEAYLSFLKDIDRKEAAVHLDICNTMNNPARLCDNSNFIRHTFGLLKDEIVTLHLKDIRLIPTWGTAGFEEVLVGTGSMDYVALMDEIAKLPDETPAMLEHLENEAQYDAASAATVAFAKQVGMEFDGRRWVRK